jgi:hypothetical protein
VWQAAGCKSHKLQSLCAQSIHSHVVSNCALGVSITSKACVGSRWLFRALRMQRHGQSLTMQLTRLLLLLLLLLLPAGTGLPAACTLAG